MQEPAEQCAVSGGQAMRKDETHRTRKKNKADTLNRTAVNQYILREQSFGQYPTERSTALGGRGRFSTLPVK